jgi:hypothetical protein
MRFQILAILIASVTVANMTGAQPRETPVTPCGAHISPRPHPQLILNQRTGEACLVTEKSDSRRIGPDSKLRIRDKELEIRVVHTLTPFNTYALNDSPVHTVAPTPLYGFRPPQDRTSLMFLRTPFSLSSQQRSKPLSPRCARTNSAAS